MDGTDAAFVAPSVQPKTGWCSHYYSSGDRARVPRLGALTEAAMHHGLVTMRTLGGWEYHDGTRADNPAALALFRRLGAPLFRRQE
ncbi:MAG: hypothetical protein R3E12_18605 [Candidatus Eisenbacteria bacterium]